MLGEYFENTPTHRVGDWQGLMLEKGVEALGHSKNAKCPEY